MDSTIQERIDSIEKKLDALAIKLDDGELTKEELKESMKFVDETCKFYGDLLKLDLPEAQKDNIYEALLTATVTKAIIHVHINHMDHDCPGNSSGVQYTVILAMKTRRGGGSSPDSEGNDEKKPAEDPADSNANEKNE